MKPGVAARALFALFALLVAACASRSTEPRRTGGRSYRMGFAPTPPRLTVAEVLRTVDSLSRHSDAALLVPDIPWAALLADTSASFLVRRDQYELAQLFRRRGMTLVVTLDPANGLDRAAESDKLVALGRSVTEPAVQRAYREYVVAFDSIVHPDWYALVMETNLIRALSSPTLYAAIVAMSNAAAQQLRAAGSTTKLMVSVQVETAWGRPGTGYAGIERDRADFPFIQALGLSSYPYLGGFAAPEDIPLDYYSRLVAASPLPMLVVEGGWTSGTVGGVTSSPAIQARYIRRQARMADAAHLVGVFQITFTDLDPSSFPTPPGSILPLFMQLGMVDIAYRPKAALAVWDSVRATALTP